MKTNNPFKLTNREYLILKRIEEEKESTLEQLCFGKGKEFAKFKDMLHFLNHKLIIRKKIRGKDETYSITEKGKEELKKKQLNLDVKNTKREKPEKKPRRISRKEKQKQLVRDVNKQKREKTIDSDSEKQDNWLEWTTPIYVEKEKRWEFYKKQGDSILEIFHSENEEEIKELHKEKVMSHIMASLHEEEEKNKANKPLATKKGEPKSDTRIKKKDTSQYIHGEVMIEIMRMKLEGISYNDLLSNIKSTYGLSLMTIGLYYSRVMEEIRERSKGLIIDTIETHLQRYEELYEWFKKNGYSKIALKALERKEKLIGLHDGEKVESGVLVGLSKGLVDGKMYNWKQLSIVERERLMLLVKRAVRVVKTKKEE